MFSIAFHPVWPQRALSQALKFSSIKSAIRDSLLFDVSEPVATTVNKVTIVGGGQVGMACAFSVLTQNVSTDIALVDVDEDKLTGEMMDLQHGSSFMKDPKIATSNDYAISTGSRLCIVTAGARQRLGESRLDLVQRNTDIFKEIIPKLVHHCPDAILLIASNPVDVMTYVAWKLSGFPENRVIGSGTNLESSRFRFLLSQRLGVAPTSCHGLIIGEHGDTSVPVWSGVNVAGVRLCDIDPGISDPSHPEKWCDLHKEVVNSAHEVIRLKGYTSWAIGLSVASLSYSLMLNTNNVHPVSTLINSNHGITGPIFMSLPCVLTSNGVSHIVQQNLAKSETENLQKSAEAIYNVQSGIKM